MADRQIKLPKLAFFEQKNMTTGSCTPEDLIARPLEPIFNYRAMAQDGALAAEYYIDNKCYELTDPDDIHRNAFPLSDDGIRAAEQWLESEYAAYDKTL